MFVGRNFPDEQIQSEEEQKKCSIQAEYIFIGGSGSDLRSKTKTIVLENGKTKIESLDQLPDWNYDGSSTNQALGENSEVWLRPIKFVPDPFRGRNNVLVLCETLKPPKLNQINEEKEQKEFVPLPTNRRAPALQIFNNPKVKAAKPWYGIEQEYTLFEEDSITPLGWPKKGYPAPQGPYYCSVGASRAFGRPIVETHYRACLYAGIAISGVNAEVMPGQWEFQVGPCEGIDSGDQLWLARYILERVAEQFNVNVSYDPKPMQGDWNGAGCHTNYSTLTMREKPGSGYAAILEAIRKLGDRHAAHMELYGKGNELRMTGKHETSAFETFTFGVANRGCSVRIPRQSYIDQKGYFEDRRPASNMDPYDVTSAIAYTTILHEDKKPDGSRSVVADYQKKSITKKFLMDQMDSNWTKLTNGDKASIKEIIEEAVNEDSDTNIIIAD